MGGRALLVAAVVLTAAPSMAAGETRVGPRLVVHARTGIGGGYELLGLDGRLTGRLGAGGGFLDLRRGGGLLIDASVTGGEDPGFSFSDSLRFELSLHIWTPRGALRLFGGTRLAQKAPFGGVTWGFPIPVRAGRRTAFGVVPELGVWIGEGAFGDTDFMLMFQVLFDAYFLVR